TGTITTTSGSPTVTGSGTSFLTELTEGATIVTQGNHTYTVQSIASNTSLTLTTNVTLANVESGATFDYTKLGPASTYTSATDWAVSSSNKESGTLAAGTAIGSK